MKKLFVIAILALSISGIAQEKRDRKKTERPELSKSQKNELQVKRLTLELDLTSQQQKEIAEIITKNQEKRIAVNGQLKQKRADKRQLSADERFIITSQMLDQRIAHKAQMRKVLNKEQYSNWENISRKNMKQKMKRAYKRKK